MKYFDSLPKIITSDNNSNSILLTNLMVRASIITEKLKDISLYYTYNIQEGDTPEIIAHKYYGDSYRYWIVLFSNELLDPQWDWPLSSSALNQYLINKYGELDVYYHYHHYEKVTEQTDITTGLVTTNVVEIGIHEYDVLHESLNTYTLPTGDVSVHIYRRAVSYYDYEYELNESKREIKLLNKEYVKQIETELKNILK